MSGELDAGTIKDTRQTEAAFVFEETEADRAYVQGARDVIKLLVFCNAAYNFDGRPHDPNRVLNLFLEKPRRWQEQKGRQHE